MLIAFNTRATVETDLILAMLVCAAIAFGSIVNGSLWNRKTFWGIAVVAVACTLLTAVAVAIIDRFGLRRQRFRSFAALRM